MVVEFMQRPNSLRVSQIGNRKWKCVFVCHIHWIHCRGFQPSSLSSRSSFLACWVHLSFVALSSACYLQLTTEDRIFKLPILILLLRRHTPTIITNCHFAPCHRLGLTPPPDSYLAPDRTELIRIWLARANKLTVVWHREHFKDLHWIYIIFILILH